MAQAKPERAGPGGKQGVPSPAPADVRTRARVIDAAVRCILEDGFYRASTNRIAARAGVSWGVIQHHFGSREALMFAVFERAMEELLGGLRAAEITGDTFEERLDALAEVVWTYYRRPEFIAYLQVGLGLAHDPQTAKDILATMGRLHDEILTRIGELADDVVGRRRAPAEVADSLFEILRGVALGLALTDAFGHRAEPREGSRDPERDVLVAALAKLLERR